MYPTDQFADAVQHQVDHVLADGVVASGVVVGRVLLARDQLLRVEQLLVRAGTHFIWYSEGKAISRLNQVKSKVMKSSK